MDPNAKDAQTTAVLRQAEAAVPAEVYQAQLGKLQRLSHELNPASVMTNVELSRVVTDNAEALAIIVKAKGVIEEKSRTLGGVEIKTQTPTIKTPNMEARVMPDYGMVTIAIPGPEGFNDKGRPLGGFELTLPSSATLSETWRNQTTHLVHLNNEGIPTDSFNLNRLPQDKVGMFASEYKQAVSAVVAIAETAK